MTDAADGTEATEAAGAKSGSTATDRLFKIAVILKGIDGGVQLLGGLLLIVIPPAAITGLANAVITRDLLGDPNGTLAQHLQTAASNFAGGGEGGTRLFAIIYLLAHGVIKLGLMWALLRKIMIAFPIGVVVLTGFVVYEVWRAVHTHSIALPIFAALDAVIIVLVLREYLKLRRERAASG